MTNGDRIREMASTNEGLAELVSKYVGCNHCPVSSDCENRQDVCEYTFKKWLNKEILKPCPFCGGEPELQHIGDVYVVKCKRCNARIERESEEFVVKHWNRRADDDEYD
jgi:Lar family restriction alleviation protein